MALTELVFNARGNKNKVTVESSDTDTPLSGVTRITAHLSVSGTTIDSDITPDDITWTDTQVTFDFGGIGQTGLQKVTLVAYSISYPEGQTIIHPEGKASLNMRFLD